MLRGSTKWNTVLCVLHIDHMLSASVFTHLWLQCTNTKRGFRPQPTNVLAKQHDFKLTDTTEVTVLPAKLFCPMEIDVTDVEHVTSWMGVHVRCWNVDISIAFCSRMNILLMFKLRVFRAQFGHKYVNKKVFKYLNNCLIINLRKKKVLMKYKLKLIIARLKK